MRLLLLTGVCLVLMSSSALACRGTAEYPQVNEQLQSSTLSTERLDALLEQHIGFPPKAAVRYVFRTVSAVLLDAAGWDNARSRRR